MCERVPFGEASFPFAPHRNRVRKESEKTMATFVGLDMGSQNTVCTILPPGVNLPVLVSNEQSEQHTTYALGFDPPIVAMLLHR